MQLLFVWICLILVFASSVFLHFGLFEYFLVFLLNFFIDFFDDHAIVFLLITLEITIYTWLFMVYLELIFYTSGEILKPSTINIPLQPYVVLVVCITSTNIESLCFQTSHILA